jgi:GMP synthase-like glutamine amidotransferase
MSAFVVLQHVACEPPAAYEDVLRARGHDVTRVMVADGDPLPELDGHAGIVAMGAPMSVRDVDSYDWLGPELDYVATAVRAGAPYWGVCFGAQLLAGALGAEVSHGPVAEVGVLPVELTAAAAGDPVFGGLPERLPAVQWHSDTFALPADAVHLASSPAYLNQAFRWGRAYGLQFHLEAPAALVEEWLAIPEYAAALRATLGADAAAPLIAAIRAREAEMGDLATRIFERWLDSTAALTAPSPSAITH